MFKSEAIDTKNEKIKPSDTRSEKNKSIGIENEETETSGIQSVRSEASNTRNERRVTPPGRAIHLAKQSMDSHEGIPLIPLSAMAGAFTSDIPVMEYECERYVIPAFKGADFLILVKGDSMQPTYHSGDLVACQKIPLSDIFFQWNKTYVLDTDQGPLIKRVRQATTADHVLLVSDNADYAPFELPVTALHAVALVRGIVRLE